MDDLSMNLIKTSMYFAVLPYLAVFLSVIFQSALLFWLGVIGVLVSLVAVLIYIDSRFAKLAAIVAFASFPHFAKLFYDVYWGGIILPVADTNFSLQLVDLTLQNGHLFPPAGTFRAVTYSYYPVTFIFSAVFAQITGVSPELFAFYIYPLLVEVAISLLFFNIVRVLIKSELVALAATAIMVLNMQLIFFYTSFHYEGMAWVFLLLVIYATLKSLHGQKYLFITISVLGAVLCALSHHLTSFILLAFLLSIGLLRMYAKMHKRIFRRDYDLEEFRNLSVATVLLPSVSILATKLLATFQREEPMFLSYFYQFLNSLFGISEAAIGTSRFNPWDYSMFEIYIVIIGNAALAGAAVVSVIWSLRQGRIQNRFMEILATNVFWIVFLVYFSSFGTTYVFRFYMPLAFIASMVVADWLFHSRMDLRSSFPRIDAGKNYRRKEITACFLIIVVLFFSSQAVMADFDSITQEPVIKESAMANCIDFILSRVSPQTGTILAIPAEDFEAIYARGRIGNPYPAGFLAFEMIIDRNLPASLKYLVLYAPLEKDFIVKFIPPDARESWILSVNETRNFSSRIFDNGEVEVDYLAYVPR